MIYFITENYLKNNTAFNNNIDMTKVEFLIPMAYDIVIVPLLGLYFSTYLLNKHQNVVLGTETYTTKEEALVDLIQPTMAWYVCSESVFDLTNQLQNKGLLTQNGDYQNSTNDNQTKYISERFFKNKEAYQNRLNHYLCKNSKDFPEFLSDDNDNSLIKDNCDNCNNSGLDDLMNTGLLII